MENLLVSGCLLGKNTKYNGKNNYIPLIEKIKEKYNIIVICPEVMGGLSIPRDPSEISGNKVINNKMKDVTFEYNKGAEIALELAIKNNCKKALLKEKSPSCGVNYIYDGTFSGNIICGMGITTKILVSNNIDVYSENEIDLLLNDL